MDWVGQGLVSFDDGDWGAGNKEAVLLALDMIQRVSRKSPGEIVDLILGWDGNRPLTIVPNPGTGTGGGYASGKLQLYATNIDNAYLSASALKTILHEMAHGIDESLGEERGYGRVSFTSHGDYNAVGWSNNNGNWIYSGSTQLGNGQGPANNYLPTPAEDFATAFASVVVQENINMGLMSLGGVDLSPIIRFTGDQNGDGTIGIDEFGPVDGLRYEIILDILRDS